MVGSTCCMNDKISLCRLSWAGLLGNRGCSVRCTGTKEQACNHTSQKTRYRFQKAATLNMNADPECPFDVHVGNPSHNTQPQHEILFCAEGGADRGRKAEVAVLHAKRATFVVLGTFDNRYAPTFLQRETT